MKPDKKIALIICVLAGNLAFGQNKPDSLGLPGDNFDLYGALEVFSKAKTPEDFEKGINLKDNEINNLDLDGDGKTDYVKVIDKVEKNGHTLIMQVAVSETETQDIAVIEVEKTGDEKAHVQIIGDEELYGKDYILEPGDQVAASEAKKAKVADDDVYSNSDNNNSQTNRTSDNVNNNSNSNVVVNVWAWPSVQYIYTPSYVVYASPWYWNSYPTWWSPWQPVYWRYHYRRAYRYHHPYYHRAYHYRSPHVHSFYYGRRSTSGTVQRNRESGLYRQRQESYKRNTQPGERYNNRPARDNNGLRNNSNVRPERQNQPVRSNENLNSTPRKADAQPRIRENAPQKSPVQTQPRQNSVPRQPKQNSQPRPSTQPKQPRTQNAPAPQRQPRVNNGGGANRSRGGQR